MPLITMFAAYCEPCDWSGPTHADNLVALRDYDRHVNTDKHVIADLLASAAEDADHEADETYSASESLSA